MSGKQLKKLDIVEAVLSNRYRDLMKEIGRFSDEICKNSQGYNQFKPVFSESHLLRFVSTKLSYRYETFPKIGAYAVFDIFNPKYYPTYGKPADKLTEAAVRKTWSEVKTCATLFKNFLQSELYYRGSDAMNLPSTVLSLLIISKYTKSFETDFQKRSKFYYWYLLNTLHNHYSGKSTNSKVDADIIAIMTSKTMEGCIDKLLTNMLNNLQLDSLNDLKVSPNYFGISGKERPEIVNGDNWKNSEKLRVLKQMMWINACRKGARDWKTDMLLEKFDKIEVHHIFPKGQFNQTNWKSRYNKLIDHPLNFAYITKRSNRIISKTPAEEYLPVLWEDFEKQIELQRQGIKQSLASKANLKRDNFFRWLQSRAEHMANELNSMLDEIRDCQAPDQPKSPELEYLLAAKETDLIEFKSTFGFNLKENRLDDVMEFEIIKAVNAFANNRGGYLYIGVDDNGSVLGLQNDLLAFGDDLDKLQNRIQQRCREAFENYKTDILDPRTIEIEGKTVIVIKVHKALNSPNAAIKTPKKRFLQYYKVGPNQRLAFIRKNARSETRLI